MRGCPVILDSRTAADKIGGVLFESGKGVQLDPFEEKFRQPMHFLLRIHGRIPWTSRIFLDKSLDPPRCKKKEIEYGDQKNQTP